jgi:hypothetical protein
MYVLELTRPGTWLQGLGDGEARAAESLLYLLETALTDATLSLSLFRDAQAALLAEIRKQPSIEQWSQEGAAKAEIRQRLARDLPGVLSAEDRWQAEQRIDHQADVEAKRQRWAQGHAPHRYLHRLSFLHAKSFLYSLDTAEKALEQLTQIPGVPDQVQLELAQFRQPFPGLKDVRDSAHHVEDRVQGKARNKKLHLLPIESSAISAPAGGALVVDMLNGDRYGGTIADGSYAEVDVTEASLVAVQGMIQRVLDAFTWRGPSRHSPD